MQNFFFIYFKERYCLISDLVIWLFIQMAMWNWNCLLVASSVLYFFVYSIIVAFLVKYCPKFMRHFSSKIGGIWFDMLKLISTKNKNFIKNSVIKSDLKSKLNYSYIIYLCIIFNTCYNFSDMCLFSTMT